MDVQVKRGILEICVLSVLARGDSYGYQIIKDMNEKVPPLYIRSSSGSNQRASSRFIP